MRALQSDSFTEDGFSICGTRLALPGRLEFSAEDEKIYKRELDRLMSIRSLPPEAANKIAMLQRSGMHKKAFFIGTVAKLSHSLHQFMRRRQTPFRTGNA
ncbi:MAG: hypothetical protein R2881_10245 [Eubacteriales bacterium]